MDHFCSSISVEKFGLVTTHNKFTTNLNCVRDISEAPKVSAQTHFRHWGGLRYGVPTPLISYSPQTKVKIRPALHPDLVGGFNPFEKY